MRFKPSDVEVRMDPEAFNWFSNLPHGETRRKIESMLDTLKERADAGNHIPRHLWPKNPSYLQINNLFRYEIDRNMRASYSIRRDESRIIVRIMRSFRITRAVRKDSTIESISAGESLHEGWEALRLGRPLFIWKSIMKDESLKWPKTMMDYGAVILEEPEQILESLPSSERILHIEI